MTTPTVPLIDGAYYWVRGYWKGAPWYIGLYKFGRFYGASRPAYQASDLAAISGPIPTPDDVEPKWPPCVPVTVHTPFGPQTVLVEEGLEPSGRAALEATEPKGGE